MPFADNSNAKALNSLMGSWAERDASNRAFSKSDNSGNWVLSTAPAFLLGFFLLDRRGFLGRYGFPQLLGPRQLFAKGGWILSGGDFNSNVGIVIRIMNQSVVCQFIGVDHEH